MIGFVISGKLGGRPGAAAGGAGVSPKVVVAGGFFIMAAALAAGGLTTAASGTSYPAAWFGAAGLGLGMVMPAGGCRGWAGICRAGAAPGCRMSRRDPAS